MVSNLRQWKLTNIKDEHDFTIHILESYDLVILQIDFSNSLTTLAVKTKYKFLSRNHKNWLKGKQIKIKQRKP